MKCLPKQATNAQDGGDTCPDLTKGADAAETVQLDDQHDDEEQLGDAVTQDDEEQLCAAEPEPKPEQLASEVAERPLQRRLVSTVTEDTLEHENGWRRQLQGCIPGA
eukprot:3468548-Rhodomonas_salina.4